MMNNKITATAFTATLLILLAGSASAQASFPDLFYGDVTIDGGDSPDGVQIVTKIDGEFSGNITTEQQGSYGYSDPLKKQLEVSASTTGKPVQFFIRTADGSLSQADELNGSSSLSVDYRAEGDIRQVDLAFDDVSIVTASAGGSYEVDQGSSVQLSGSSSGFDSPSYSWSIRDDPTNSVNLNNKNSRKATFQAPDNVDSDQDVKVRLKVSDDQNSKSATSTATVTVVNTDTGSTDSGSTGGQTGGAGGVPGEGNESDQPESPEPVDVEAQVDNVTGSASGSANASSGQTVTVSIPENVDENVTGEVEGQEAATEVESVSATASGDTSISVSVSSVSSDEVQERKDNQISYSNIEVDGEVSNQVITFSVRKSVLEERNASAGQVVQERYSDGEWQELETREIEELDDRHRFEAETDGNSIFAVAIKDDEVEQPVDGNQTDTNQTNNETQEQSPEDSGGLMPWIVGLVVILLAGVLYFREELVDFAVSQVPDETGSSESSSDSSSSSSDDSPVKIVDDEEEEEKDQESDDSDEDSSDEEDED